MKCWIWKHFVKFHRDLSHFYYYYYYHKRTKDWPGLQKQLPKYFKYCGYHRVPQVLLVISIIPFNHWAWTLYPTGTTSLDFTPWGLTKSGFPKERAFSQMTSCCLWAYKNYWLGGCWSITWMYYVLKNELKLWQRKTSTLNFENYSIRYNSILGIILNLSTWFKAYPKYS